MTTYVRREKLLLLSITWLAFALRIYHLSFQSLWRDEVDVLRFATRPWPELLAMFRSPGENGPLFFVALRPWIALAGRTEFSLRFPSAFAGTLAVPVTYILVRRLVGERKTAAIVMLLMAAAPYLTWYSQDAKMYALLTALVPLALWLTVDAIQRGHWWRWCLLYAVTSLCFYVHLLAVLVVSVQVIWLWLVPARRRPFQRALIICCYLAVLFVPYVPLAAWQVRAWLAPVSDTGYPFVPLPQMLLVLVIGFSQGILPVREPVTLLPAMLGLIAGGALWAVVRPSSQTMTSPNPADSGNEDTATGQVVSWGRWRTVALLAIWLLLPPLELYLISLNRPIFADRYLIWVMPPFLTLVAMGVVGLNRIRQPVGSLTLAAFLALGLVGVLGQAYVPYKSDFRSAAAYVQAHRKPGDLLIFQIPYGRYTYAYYASGTLNPSDESQSWLDGPYTNNGMGQDALASYLAQGTAGVRAIWLVASETSLWDRSGLTESWLAAHGDVTDSSDFARVSVTKYELHRQS